MRRALPLLLVTAWVVLAGAGGVPVEAVWRYGPTPSCAPTGRAVTVEGVEFVEIGPGIARMGSNEMPVHRVEFANGFWIAWYEAFGFHDMHGNLREWCGDGLHSTCEGVPARALSDGGATMSERGSTPRVGLVGPGGDRTERTP